MPGGRREGAGRPKGAKNKRTTERLQKAQDDGLSPLEYLLSVMRDETAERPIRTDAAKAAAPYIHPRLNSVEVGGKDGKPISVTLTASDAEL